MTVLIPTMRRTPVESALDGDLVKVAGRLRYASPPISAPITCRPCAGYDASAEAWEGGDDTTIVAAETCAVDFLVVDESGAALVRAADAELVLVRDRELLSDALDPLREPALCSVHARFLARHGQRDVRRSLLGEVRRSLRFCEGALEEGAFVSVIGLATREPDPLGPRGYRDARSRLVIQPPRSAPLLVTNDPDSMGSRLTDDVESAALRRFRSDLRAPARGADWEEGSSGLTTLGSLAGPERDEAERLLLEAMARGSRRAVRGLGALRSHAAVPRLVPLLFSWPPLAGPAVAEAALALWRIEDSQAALRCLGQLGRRALRWTTRRAALSALQACDVPEARHVLWECLLDRNPRVRLHACRALLRLRREAPPAGRHPLEEQVLATDPAVHRAVLEALRDA